MFRSFLRMFCRTICAKPAAHPSFRLTKGGPQVQENLAKSARLVASGWPSPDVPNKTGDVEGCALAVVRARLEF